MPDVDGACRIAGAFDLSSVTRAFYRQIVREQRIPLNLSYAQPNAESREALAEAAELMRHPESYQGPESVAGLIS